MAHEKAGKAPLMKVLIDTNVALDIMLHRKDYAVSEAVSKLAEKNAFSGFISASAITDIFYIAKSTLGKKPTKEALKELLKVFRPATVTDNDIFHALSLDWDDFEDSVQFAVGESFDVDYIVTRNTKDYSASTIPAIEPDQFVQLFKKSSEGGTDGARHHFNRSLFLSSGYDNQEG
jgi:predicted nucleic acid-binding protein